MDAQMVEVAIRMHFAEMSERLEQANGIARAAQACAEAGNIEKAVEIALDVEPLLYDVTTFLNAASLMKRIYKS